MVLQEESQYKPQSMKNQINNDWISADVKALIEPPQITFSKK